MKHFLNSATKFVLAIIVLDLVVITTAIVLTNIHDANVVTSFVALFSSLATLIVGFYFGQKGLNIPPENK